MSTQRHGRKSVPTGTRGGHQSSKCPPAWLLLPSMQLLELLWGCGEGPVLRPCSTGQSGESESLHAAEGARHTARAPGRKQRRSWGSSTCNTGSARSGGGRERALLVSPQQSRNKQTMALSSSCFQLRSQGTEQNGWAGVLEPGSGVALLGQRHGPPPAVGPADWGLSTASL